MPSHPWGRPTYSLRYPSSRHQTIRGGGQSYSAAACGTNIVQPNAKDKTLAFCGPNLARIPASWTVLQACQALARRGLTLPVIPGTPRATLGGCLAADVHGKAHPSDGAFSEHVESCQIETSRGMRITLATPHPTFLATAAGYGLTGVIHSLVIRLKPIETTWMRAWLVATKSLSTTLHYLSGLDPHIQALAILHQPARSAHDRGARIICAQWALLKDLPSAHAESSLAWPDPPARWTPNLPFQWLSKLGCLMAQYRLPARSMTSRLVHANSILFPAGHDYWKLFGPQGLLQYHAWIPCDAGEQAIGKFLAILGQASLPLLLSLRRTGRPSRAYLGFIGGKGWSLAIDGPNCQNWRKLFPLCHAETIKHGGRVYLAKTDDLSPANLRAMYPNLDQWQEIQATLDPLRLWSSDMAIATGLLTS